MPLDLSAEAFCQYLSAFKPPSTVGSYKVGVKHLIDYVRERRIDIHKAPGLLLGFTSWLLVERDLSSKSLQVMLPAVKKYLEWRRAHGDPLPVFAKPETPRVKHDPPVVLKEAAIKAYVALARSSEEPFRTVALIFPFTGLRLNEACCLKLNQITRDTSDPQRKRFILRRVKGKSKQIRDVPILDPGNAVLYGYLTGWRRGVFESQWLFPSELDWTLPYNDRTCRRKIDEIEHALGVPKLSAGILRHTWSTALADQGVPMHHVAQMAGHESVQTTYKHYIGRADPSVLGAEASKVKLFAEEKR